MVRCYGHITIFFRIHFHIGDFLFFRINMIDLRITAFHRESTEGDLHRTRWLDLFLPVLQGDVQQIFPDQLRFLLFLHLIREELVLFLFCILLFCSYRDLLCRIGQRGTHSRTGHLDSAFRTGSQDKFLFFRFRCSFLKHFRACR